MDITNLYSNLTWSCGIDLKTDGKRIGVDNMEFIPPALLEQIKQHKQAMIELLKTNEKAREAGFLVLEDGRVYSKQYSLNGYIFIEKEGDKWNAWRETWGKESSTVGEIATQVNFDLALFHAKQRYDYITGKRNDAVV